MAISTSAWPFRPGRLMGAPLGASSPSGAPRRVPRAPRLATAATIVAKGVILPLLPSRDGKLSAFASPWAVIVVLPSPPLRQQIRVCQCNVQCDVKRREDRERRRSARKNRQSSIHGFSPRAAASAAFALVGI